MFPLPELQLPSAFGTTIIKHLNMFIGQKSGLSVNQQVRAISIRKGE
jgi:hypothetical protein